MRSTRGVGGGLRNSRGGRGGRGRGGALRSQSWGQRTTGRSQTRSQSRGRERSRSRSQGEADGVGFFFFFQAFLLLSCTLTFFFLDSFHKERSRLLIRLALHKCFGVEHRYRLDSDLVSEFHPSISENCILVIFCVAYSVPVRS